MLADLLTRPVTITRRSGAVVTDPYGNETREPVTVETVGELQRRQRLATEEPGGMGEFSDTSWLLVLPAGTTLTTADSVTVDGEDFEVVGDPWHVRNPRTGAESHVEVTVRRTAGAEDGAEVA